MNFKMDRLIWPSAKPGPNWYVRESFADKLRRWKITAFLIVVIASGLVQFGWQLLFKFEDE